MCECPSEVFQADPYEVLDSAGVMAGLAFFDSAQERLIKGLVMAVVQAVGSDAARAAVDIVVL